MFGYPEVTAFFESFESHSAPNITDLLDSTVCKKPAKATPILTAKVDQSCQLSLLAQETEHTDNHRGTDKKAPTFSHSQQSVV